MVGSQCRKIAAIALLISILCNGTAIYGTPFYLTKEDRNQLYAAKFPYNPGLEVQRDIFVFQCFIGCRVGDLMKLTKDNVINDAIEYVPRKTKETIIKLE